MERILVPTDFSDTCYNAIRHAMSISRESSLIYVLHVVKEDIDKVEYDKYESKVIGLVKSLSTMYNDFQKIIPITCRGDIFKTIDDVALEYDVDFIILGTHGKEGIQKLIGSHILKVVDSTEKPVIIIQGDTQSKGIKNIVFPLNIFQEDRQKAEQTAKLARDTNATVHIVAKDEPVNNAAKLNNVITQLRNYFSKYNVNTVIQLSDGMDFDRYVINYSSNVNADIVVLLTDSTFRIPFVENKEEKFIFNNTLIPVMLVSERKLKSVNFSVAG